ncbi:hypothetical protein GCM10025862_17080 [Arsenicicoccus piscis]|uniref:Histidine ammonia-lyase n=1 Tax=Arsenicicoccus piscis TaxID=673954 RepID=A0ABQ6HNG1_9MICO|nr:hypothetical protein GCM10025862_17080 [Arsenicicoccus piscis]
MSNTTRSTVTLASSGITPADVVAVARHDARVELASEARAELERVRGAIDAMAASDTPVYGISTGFGALATTHIPAFKRAKLQQSLVRSHAAGMGPAVERETVRALMFLRAKTLASGHTGIRPSTLDTYLAILNAGITPVVREFGSLGCSGDLSPLAHCALVLMGEEGDRSRRCRASGRRAARRGRHRARGAGREGRPGAHQRHRRHARPAGARAG